MSRCCDLLEGTDERIAELEFAQDEFNPNLVVAEVANDSELRVLVESVDGEPCAVVRFVAFDFDEEEFEELEDESIHELWELGDDFDDDRLELLSNGLGEGPVIEIPAETLELGTYTDFDRLFDVLGLVSEQALDWEAQLVSFDDDDYDEPEVYDIFGADDLDADELDGDDDFDEDEDDVETDDDAEGTDITRD